MSRTPEHPETAPAPEWVLRNAGVRLAFARLAGRIALDGAGLGPERSDEVAQYFYEAVQRGGTDCAEAALVVVRMALQAAAQNRPEAAAVDRSRSIPNG